MGIVECRECHEKVSDEARTCPHCGVDTPSQDKLEEQRYIQEYVDREQRMDEWVSYAFKAAFGVAVLWFIFSGKAAEIFESFRDEVLTACTIENVTLESDVFIINGEADAGVRATVLVRKESGDGNVKVSATLSSSEGDVTKQRTVNMREGQRSNVVLQFPEPTINAINITGQAKCSTF